MRPLVEARRDGRLGEREVAALERHLATCAACRTTTDRLARIAERSREPVGPPVTALDHQRKRLALLRAAALAEQPAPPATSRRGVRLALALALVLCTVAAVRLRAQAPVVPPLARLADVVRRSIPRPETVIRPIDDARFSRLTTATLDRVELAEGAIDLEVRPLHAGERFLVTTRDAEVEVRGTSFRVRARASQLVGVEVREGKVEVRHTRGTSLLGPGEAWPATEVLPALPVAAPTERTAPTDHRLPAIRRPPAPPAPSTSASTTPDAANGFNDAMGLIDRGDYAAAAEKLDAFRTQRPTDPRAEDAAYLSVIALQRAGQKTAAAAAARRFLGAYPKSPRRAAVQAILDDL